MRILITGGAGFIGGHVADRLRAAGHCLRILDRLERPTHPDGQPPAYLSPHDEFIHGDVGDPDCIRPALRGMDAVVHLAATGGFTSHIAEYVRSNSLATAVLLEEMQLYGGPRRILVASSIGVYGEGEARCPVHGDVAPEARPNDQLARSDWAVRCPICDRSAQPRPTRETRPIAPGTHYGLTKYDQERLVLEVAQREDWEASALRFFVTYGPRQSPHNPYTGVVNLFTARLVHGHQPLLYEDGGQTRDFVHVYDVARIVAVLLDCASAAGQVLNVGTGRGTSVRRLAELVGATLESPVRPHVPGWYRPGEVRHMVADVTRLAGLGLQAEIQLEEALYETIQTLLRNGLPPDRTREMEQTLLADGVVRAAHTHE